MFEEVVDVPETAREYDVVVVGAGIGGLYGVHRFVSQGLSVLGLEGASGVGGVWHYNRYPGARVDIESFDYCYYFSSELYNEWEWSERYATQPELLRYLNHVADRFDIRRHFLFETWVTGAQWNPDTSRYRVTVSSGDTFTCRFLVMATGNLSAARDPQFPGLENFQGEWVQASHWPDHEVELTGRRIGVIGTGSSGVQTIPVVAQVAAHVTVFQRSPNFSVPAHNGPMSKNTWESIRHDVPGARKRLLASQGGRHITPGTSKAADLTPEQREQALEEAWAYGGHVFQRVFADQGTDAFANSCAADFVRNKIRGIVDDPALAEKLCPQDHPIGSRRLCVDTDYYATYNRENVTLVDVSEHAIERFDETGIITADGTHHELDLVIFALGFNAFTGAIDNANIRNAEGASPTDHWDRGPRTLLGMTTTGFPNLFVSTGPGSPAVLANLTLHNEQCMDWIGDCIAYLDKSGYSTIEASREAQDEWTTHVAEAAGSLLRLRTKNYMVHVNADDESRVFIPYVGGFGKYVARCNEVAENGYEGFVLK